MKYFFELGSNPALCLAEISASLKRILPKAKKYYFSDDKKVLVASFASNLAVEPIINKLGGIVKIGLVAATIKTTGLSNSEIKEKFFSTALTLLTQAARQGQGKFRFGFSGYGLILPYYQLGLKIKKELSEQGLASRLVTSRNRQLSSVVVATNKLISSGYELVIIKAKEQIFLGRTLVVQPFKDWSARDYGRPARDDYAGMLPPKLARIMINLAQADKQNILLDPFCGSGTILTEALLLGYKDLIGADISSQALRNTLVNLNWTVKKYKLKKPKIQLIKVAVNNLSQKIKTKSIGAIITEPYLGQPRGRINFNQQVKELNLLYSQALKEFAHILPPAGRLVMVWPVFRLLTIKKNSQKIYFLNPDLNKFQLVNPLLPEFNQWVKLGWRRTIIYGRPNQRIWREIVILRRA